MQSVQSREARIAQLEQEVRRQNQKMGTLLRAEQDISNVPDKANEPDANIGWGDQALNRQQLLTPGDGQAMPVSTLGNKEQGALHTSMTNLLGNKEQGALHTSKTNLL